MDHIRARFPSGPNYAFPKNAKACPSSGRMVGNSYLGITSGSLVICPESAKCANGAHNSHKRIPGGSGPLRVLILSGDQSGPEEKFGQ